MSRKLSSLLVAGFALTLLGGCDYIRFPGDGGPPPKTPEAPEPLPPGAPGPPPPALPVDDPYGTGETPDDTTVAEPGTPDTPSTDDPASPDTPLTDPVPDGGGGETPAPTPDTPDNPSTDEPVDGGGTGPAPAPEPEPEPVPVLVPKFSYFAPGALITGTGQGQSAQIVHAPDLVFPIKTAPAYLQSMVFNYGGGPVGGDQCDARNFAYPWRDNFCETRSANRGSPLCPVNKIHQGQDIRVGTPDECKLERKAKAADRERYEAVAVADGVISNVGTYSITLRGEGVQYKYMHLNMTKLKVTTGQTVKAGDLLGYVSNDFGGTPTVLHLHFEIVQNTAEHGWAHVPPYLSLVEAYERREAGPGTRVEPGDVSIASAPPPAFVITPGMEIIE